MKLLKKSMLVLSAMTLIGGMSFAAATKTARLTTKAGKVYNLNIAVSGSGSRYVSKNGNIEFFKGGKDAMYRGSNGIEKSCTKR